MNLSPLDPAPSSSPSVPVAASSDERGLLNEDRQRTVAGGLTGPSRSASGILLRSVPQDVLVGVHGSDPISFESNHVHKVYDVIASHFSSTRYKPWPRVREFVESLPLGSFMADIGCGNGKNLAITDKISSFGCDMCEALVRIASGQHLEVSQSDALRTPYRNGCMDAAISIAVIHHFSTNERRVASILELIRIVKDGGAVLIYVWAREQPKKRCEEASNGDVMIPWEVHKKFDEGETVHERYYHLFRKGELESLCTTDKRIQAVASVESSYFDKENWCVILRVKREKPLVT